MNGFLCNVNVAACGPNLRKIGASNSPERRVKALRQEHRMIFTLERVWHLPDFDARTIEALTHYHLDDRRVRGHGREFFAATFEDIANAVESAIAADDALDPTVLPRHHSLREIYAMCAERRALRGWVR